MCTGEPKLYLIYTSMHSPADPWCNTLTIISVLYFVFGQYIIMQVPLVALENVLYMCCVVLDMYKYTSIMLSIIILF